MFGTPSLIKFFPFLTIVDCAGFKIATATKATEGRRLQEPQSAFEVTKDNALVSGK
jgi:hypothetical protein